MKKEREILRARTRELVEGQFYADDESVWATIIWICGIRGHLS